MTYKMTWKDRIYCAIIGLTALYLDLRIIGYIWNLMANGIAGNNITSIVAAGLIAYLGGGAVVIVLSVIAFHFIAGAITGY